MRRSGIVSLAGILVVAAGALVLSLIAGNSVLLGLDLEGGAEVVLEPAADTELTGEDLDSALDRSVEIIRNRVDGLGVAEPDITRQGQRIVVQLPGVEDQQRALEVVGQTAELRFRPVCAVLPAEVVDSADAEAAAAADGATDNTPVSDIPFGISPLDTDSVSGIDAATTDGTAETDAAQGANNDTAFPGAVGCENIGIEAIDAFSMPSTDRDDDDADVVVILPEIDPVTETVARRYLLGRTMLTGSALEDADATFTGFEWLVRPTFRAGPEGIDLFNEAAQACNFQSPACPSQQLGIVLDGVVNSAPTIQQPFFQRDSITITGGFDQSEAEDTALVLKFGALPLEFGDPTDPLSGSRVRLVSATLGKDSLEAGVVAGIVGLALVAMYMIAYYLLLGVAAILSLMVSGSMLWVVLAYMSERSSLALTLAGVVGLIVSIGTSLDSNVVYFEHLKEDVTSGRTLRSSVDRSFPVAFRTIVYANMTSLIGATILYFLTVGSVRGFALMLGLASVLDLVATYFFLRPAIRLLARGKTLVDNPGLYGMPRPEDLSVR
ncbi:MAG: protein translocase subunit SecD [Acidimicrobiales bacterium]